MSDILNLIVVPQEHDSANHRDLWAALAAQSPGSTWVLNIGADLVVSLARRRFDRLWEAIRRPVRDLSHHSLLRPFFLVRPEVSPTLLNTINAWLLRRSLLRAIPDLDSRDVRVLIYNGLWAALFHRVVPSARIFYYVIDEVTRTAHTDQIHPKRQRWDQIGCARSSALFVVSEALAEPRRQHAKRILVIGNGAAQEPPVLKSMSASDRVVVGLIGNFRNWIDMLLLEELVASCKDWEFMLVGPVERDMRPSVEHLQSRYKNVKHHGSVPKDDVATWYRRCSVIIVPYIQNRFMHATRPIKVVEAVFSGTPVVTIPVSGFRECDFIRFARTAPEFREAISSARRIDFTSDAYRQFVDANAWPTIAGRILKEFDSDAHGHPSQPGPGCATWP